MVRNVLKQIRKQVIDNIKIQYRIMLGRIVSANTHMRDVMALERTTDTQEYGRYLIALWFVNKELSNINLSFTYKNIKPDTHACLLECAKEAQEHGTLADDKLYIGKLLDEAVENYLTDRPLIEMYNHKYFMKKLGILDKNYE